MSELSCPYCGFNCGIPSNIEEKIECPSCRGIFLYIQQSKSNGEIDCRPSPEINDGSRQVSELKAYTSVDIEEMDNAIVYNTGKLDRTRVYLKSEADKVIADLEMKLAVARQALRLNQPEALYSNLETMGRLHHEIDVVKRRERHHKYKRCLAMAKWCMARYNEWVAYYPTTTTRKMKFLDKWEKRWLELAEKFKEAK